MKIIVNCSTNFNNLKKNNNNSKILCWFSLAPMMVK